MNVRENMNGMVAFDVFFIIWNGAFSIYHFTNDIWLFFIFHVVFMVAFIGFLCWDWGDDE